MRHIFLGLGMSLALAGCASTRNEAIPYNNAAFTQPDLPTAVPESRTYRAGPGDELTLRVYNAPEFSGDYAVDDRGMITLPLVGDVLVLNRPINEIGGAIETVLGRRMLRSPQVTVQFKTRANNRVTLDGAVRMPGNYAFSGELTLIRAVAMGQGPSETANTGRVIVFRQINGVRNAAAFDMSAIREGLANDPTIYPNDVIYVDSSSSRQLFRDFVSTIPLIGIFRPF